jgi:hypothetical protein
MREYGGGVSVGNRPANARSKQIQIILDILSSHKTGTVTPFLEQNPRVRFHFTGPVSMPAGR